VSRRRVLLRISAIATATVAAGSGWLALAPAANAVSNIQTAYWSALPAAPQVPTGGYEVGSNPTGADAVAALRFTLAPGEKVQKLSLSIAQAQPATQVAIEACPIAAKSATWQPPSGGSPGPQSSAPTADCGQGVFGGALSADGKSMNFDLSLASFPSSVVNLLLQPAQVSTAFNSLPIPGAPSQSSPSFDATFQPLTAAQISVETTAAPPPVASSGSGVTAPAPAPAASAPASGGGAVALPPASTGTGQAPGAAPVVAPTQQPSNVSGVAPVALVQKGRNWRLLFFIALLSTDLLFGLLWLQRQQPGAGERPKLSIYDPPPAPAPAKDAAPAT
jgi:hypothetical protein